MLLPWLLLSILLGLPVVLGLVFRVSAPHLFFSIMAGELLARYFATDVERIVESVTHNPTIVGYTEPPILLIPLLLTAIFLKGSLPTSRTILNIVPLAVTGVVFAAFMGPLLPEFLQIEIAKTQYGDQLLSLSNVIIGGVVALQLVALWLLNRGNGHKHHKKR
jgi:hypothetical protein